MNESFYNFITEDLSSGLTCLSYNHVIHFCTLDKQFFNIDIKQPQNKKTLFCYDVFNNKIMNIVLDDIEYCHVINVDDKNENNKNVLDIIEFCKPVIAELQLTTDKSVDEIYNTILDSTFIDFTGIKSSKQRINFLKMINLSIPIKNILLNEIDDCYNNDIIDAFKLMVNKEINKNVKELDLLIDQCETEEDKEDVEAIKEMFYSTTDDIETEDIKIKCGSDLIDLFDLWPPILLPLPSEISNLKSDVDDIFNIDSVDMLAKKEISNIIKGIDNIEELESFLTELEGCDDSKDDLLAYCKYQIKNRIERINDNVEK